VYLRNMDPTYVYAILVMQGVVLSAVSGANSFIDENMVDSPQYYDYTAPWYSSRTKLYGSGPPLMFPQRSSSFMMPYSQIQPSYKPYYPLKRAYYPPQLIPQQQQKQPKQPTSANGLCSTDMCLHGTTCRVVQLFTLGEPMPVCLRHSALPPGCDDECQSAGFSQSVLYGQPMGGGLKPFRCFVQLAAQMNGGCAQGASCVNPSPLSPNPNVGTCCVRGPVGARTALNSANQAGPALLASPAAAMPMNPFIQPHPAPSPAPSNRLFGLG